MKKLFFAAVALLVILPAQAQFRLTDKGFVNSEDKKSGSIVIECPGMSKCQIADAVGYFSEARLSNPWTHFNGLGCDSFTVNGVATEAIYNGRGIFRENYDMEYRIMFDYSDGMLRVWSPEIMGISRRKPCDVSTGVSVGIENGNIGVGLVHHNAADDIAYMYVSENYRPLGGRGYGYKGTAIFNRRGGLKQKYAKQSLEDYFNGFVVKLEEYLRSK